MSYNTRSIQARARVVSDIRHGDEPATIKPGDARLLKQRATEFLKRRGDVRLVWNRRLEPKET